MRYLKRSLVITALLLAVGSNLSFAGETPSAYAFLSEPQQKVVSSQHWKIIAKQMVDAFSETVASSPISIKNNDKTTQFGNTLEELLEDEFMRRGYTLVQDPNQATVFEYTTKLVNHKSHQGHQHQFGSLTALGAGVMLVPAIAKESWQAWTLSTALLGDTVLALKATPTRTELLVRVKATVPGDVRVYSNTEIFYIEHADVSLYNKGTTLQLKDIEVK